jgi:hypothetical protein
MSTIAEIAALLKLDGPFVSAYLATPSNEPNAAFRLATHWKSTRSALAEAGADEATLTAMDAAVGVDTDAVKPQASAAPENHPASPVDGAGDHAGGEVLAIVAADGQVLVREPLPTVSGGGTARVAAVPWLTPLLEAAQTRLPYVLALVDRSGADLHGCGWDTEVESSVEGSHDQIERNRPGGWSQRRYQQRSIDSWERNGEEVAAAVESLARRLNARLILVGGDEHAVSYTTGALSGRWEQRVHVLQHATRAAGGDVEAMNAEVDELVRAALAEEQAAVLERFAREKGQRDRAADGPARVVEALQAAMVDTLLVHDDADDDRPAWFGPEPNQLGLGDNDLHSMGVRDPGRARLIDLAIRAALGTGATVRLVPPSAVRDGLGATLRA